MLPFVHGRENQTGRKEIKVAPQNVYWEKNRKKESLSTRFKGSRTFETVKGSSAKSSVNRHHF